MDSVVLSPNRVDVNLKITGIECHPESLVIAFQGQDKAACELDYYILQNEIQRVFKERGKVYIGEFCLVEDAEGTWHRGRVLEKSENICEVFLVDAGQVLVVEETHLASACDEFFKLPPKVVLGVFASILPLGEKWDPKAVNYFSSLVGLQIRGHVKAVTSYQLFILEVPKITTDILELKLGKHIDVDSFCVIVDVLRALPKELHFKTVPQVLQQKYSVKGLLTCSNFENPTDFWPVPQNLFPRLPVDSEENVKVTVALSQNKLYCQMQKWQKELEDLTKAMHSCYEGKKSVDSLGLLCAAKRQSGQWHRGVIKQVLSDYVEVWFMDFGNSEAVPHSYVHKLKAEFMALPMISFPCALSCFSSGDENVIKIQLKQLTQALIGQTSVCVHIDVFSNIKHLYYITLQNKKLEVKAEHPKHLNETAASRVSLSDTKITSIAESYKSQHECCSSCKDCTGNNCVEKIVPRWDISLSSCCRRVEMKVNSCYTASVVHVINPSDFFIQTCEYQNEFQALMKNIADTYNRCGADEMTLKDLKPGFLCCARYSKDMCYYRAVVIEVLHVNVTVYFLDFGNRDTVPCYYVKTLLPEFSDLPALALCCALDCVFPVDGVWVKKAIDYFKEIVFNKLLLLHVTEKESNKYIVNASYRSGLQQECVATCMFQAGYAEYWEKTPNSVLNLGGGKQNLNSRKCRNRKVLNRSKMPGNREVFQEQKPLSSASSVLKEPVVLPCFGKGGISERHKLVHQEKLCYKELVFQPGTVLEVVCSCIVSPANFSCQLQSKLPVLNNLMEQIQTYYKEHTSPYKTGQIACVAKYSKDGKWYRATVVQQVSTNEADVVFVDYGYQERVLLKDLQAVTPDFLTLESQAFRCGLKNVHLQSNSFQWSEEVCRHFESLISTSSGPLTCTIYAVVLISPNCLCNIIDLQTPSVTAEKFLRECGLMQPGYTDLRNLASLGSPYSFCYSSFNIKIGSEEEVYITHIYSPKKFYCQLNRNTETIEALMKKVNVVSEMSKDAKYDTSSTRLCIARYFEDGLFYRALAFPVESTSYVFVDFVDFGNKSMVERDQLIPIPSIATDLIFTPMQAIKCCLADSKETDIPAKVTRWFEKTFYGKLLKAVIVSRESDGQLVMELYDGYVSVSQKIEEKILEEFPLVIYTGQLARSNKRAIHHIKDDKECSKVVELSIAEIGQLKTEVKSQVYDGYYGTNTEQNFVDEEQTACSTQNLCSGFSKLTALQNSEEPGFRNTVNTVLENREESPVGKLPSRSLCHPALKSKEIIVSKINNKMVIGKFLQQNRTQWERGVICSGKFASNDLRQEKGRTRCQNTPMHNLENRPKQIVITNGNPQVRKSRNRLCGWSKREVIRTKTTSKMPLKGLLQNTNSGQVEVAKVTSISESGEFYVQLHRNLQVLEKLNVMLTDEAQRRDFLRVDDIEEGLECMTKSEMDLKWYRTKVLKMFIREKLMLVFVVDYGYCEMVCLNSAKMLSDEIKKIPKQAVFCKWIWFKNLKKIQFLHVVNALLNCDIKILFLRYLESSHIWEVDILIGEILLQEYLKQLLSNFQTIGPEKWSNTDCMEFSSPFKINSITWMLLRNDKRHLVFPAAITDPSNFCIQFEILLNVMQNLSLLLSDLPDDLPALPEELVSPGATCLINFGPEAEWNRAEISEVTSQSVVLKFIDYGFLKTIPYSDIHKLKVIPDSLLYLPHLAHSCSLHDIVPVTGECWSDEAKVLFHRLLSKPGLILHFKHYGPGMKLEVDVLYEECSVAHDLIDAGCAVYPKIRCCLDRMLP